MWALGIWKGKNGLFCAQYQATMILSSYMEQYNTTVSYGDDVTDYSSGNPVRIHIFRLEAE